MNKNKISILFILAIISIIVGTTFSWLYYRTTDTALVLKVGDVSGMVITVKPYVIDGALTLTDNYQNDGKVIDVTATNNHPKKQSFDLYFDIDNIDSALNTSPTSNYFKYIVLKSTTGNANSYTETVATGDFTGANASDDFIIYSESVDTNTTYYYKVYIYLEKDMNADQSALQNKTFKAEFRADIGGRTLYNVLKRAATTGTYAREYTGSHQDSMDPSKSTETIYYWYGSDATNGTAILNMNNVIFADQCWQMIRTTDTGGVRLMYNGEPTITVVNGETQYDCSTSRPGHIGGIKTTQSLSGSYYYGDGYTTSVSGTTTTYTLTNATQVTISTSNAVTEIPTIAENYPYTCRSNSATGTCTTLYKVDSQSSGATAYVYASTYRDAIGTSAFNSNYNSVGDVGYMYNSRYAVSNTSMSKSVTMLGSVTLNSSNLTTYGNYYFGDGYSLSGNNHVLSNAVKGNTITDYPSSWAGMYQCNSSSSSSCATAYYVTSVDTSGTNPIMYRATLASGKTETDSTYKYLFGEGLQDNGDGTFSLTGTVEEVAQKDWNTKYSAMTNKFVCMPGYYTYDSNTGANTCYDTRVTNKVDAIGYVSATTITNFTYRPVYKYGFGFGASGSNYKLVGNNNEDGTLQYIYNWASTSNSSCFANSSSISDCGYKTLSKSHYTCFNLSGECSTYYYINYTTSSGAYSAPITGGKYVSTDVTDKNNILYLALYQNDANGKVNTTNSTIKGNVDTWYQNTLLTNFDNYIDDTIYCNNRTITNFGGWNPNGGTTDSNYTLQFREYSVSSDLSCPNTTDKFSVSNNDAKLTYKVGLMSSPELNLLNQANARTSAFYYWLASPYYFYGNDAFGRSVSTNGSLYYNYVNSAGGVRPAVSLISGIEYSAGDGSMAKPYVVDLSSINN